MDGLGNPIIFLNFLLGRLGQPQDVAVAVAVVVAVVVAVDVAVDADGVPALALVVSRGLPNCKPLIPVV